MSKHGSWHVTRGTWQLTIGHTLSDGSGHAGPIVRYVSPEGCTHLAYVSHDTADSLESGVEVIVDGFVPDASDDTKAIMAADLRDAIAAWRERRGR